MIDGRRSTTDKMREAYVTAIVTNWLRTDPQALDYWVSKARRIRASVVRSRGGKKNSDEIDAEAALELSVQLRDELESKMPPVQGIYKDLLDEAFLRVMWAEVAEDLLTH